MKIKIALASILVCFATIATAQPKYIQKAELAYASQNYSEAAEKCSYAYTKLNRRNKKKKGDMAFKTAQCYRLTERYRDANEWFERTILLDYQEIEPTVFLYNADMLRQMGEFEKAIESYDDYLKLVPGDDRATTGKQSCAEHKNYIVDKSKHIIENQAVINVKQFDMAPMIGNRKNTKMYYSTSRDGSTGNDKDPRTGEGYMDLWVTDIDKKGNWTEPYLVPGENINTVDNEGTVCFDSRYKQMFFTRCPNLKKQNLGCDIWVSEAKGKTEWKDPIKITGIKSHDSVSVGHPCTADGKYLIFAHDNALRVL